ncbi:uncharacterized protein MONBRDRAFT_6179 [Monosiga brevicollis MX1]|uniref:Uncharacterized protein n=1 Tax=Monosiga brevicollis TaxID=81824 RepID=A9UT24_MONBE|nr:uncharacterized protein MONBRDRAFT_6179 [Monosiga brevicollis MX1]EDQ91170.1 predicted protein [Monosiga brevicollis MX1]|eukprot:XP_001743592.1 hypothetical protein [Monosiga brevicollis MX1]
MAPSSHTGTLLTVSGLALTAAAVWLVYREQHRLCRLLNQNDRADPTTARQHPKEQASRTAKADSIPIDKTLDEDEDDETHSADRLNESVSSEWCVVDARDALRQTPEPRARERFEIPLGQRTLASEAEVFEDVATGEDYVEYEPNEDEVEANQRFREQWRPNSSNEEHAFSAQLSSALTAGLQGRPS